MPFKYYEKNCSRYWDPLSETGSLWEQSKHNAKRGGAIKLVNHIQPAKLIVPLPPHEIHMGHPILGISTLYWWRHHETNLCDGADRGAHYSLHSPLSTVGWPVEHRPRVAGVWGWGQWALCGRSNFRFLRRRPPSYRDGTPGSSPSSQHSRHRGRGRTAGLAQNRKWNDPFSHYVCIRNI